MTPTKRVGTVNYRDAHVHLVEHGEHLDMCDLSACTSIEDALLALRAESVKAAEHNPATTLRGWVRAHGYRIEAIRERRYPTCNELDDIASDRPVVVTSFDHHSCSTNSAGLQTAGITEHSPHPRGGIIERTTTGKPTGVLLEAAAALLWAAEPDQTSEDTARWLTAGVDHLKSQGFVEAHEMRAQPAMASAVLGLLNGGKLDSFRLRVHATPEVFQDVASVLDSAQGIPVGRKLFVDGTVNSRTAWMLDPYADPIDSHPFGIGNYTVDQLAQHMRDTRDWGERSGLKHGAEVAAHAIGDGAVRALLDAYDRVEAEGNGDAGVDLRIEHAQFISARDIDRFTHRPDGSVRSRWVIASVQPCHLLPDMEAIQRLLGHNAERAFPLHDLIESASNAEVDPVDAIVFGSDTPIVRPSVPDNMQAAVHRRRATMTQEHAIAPDQAITEENAQQLSLSRPWRGREST